VEFIDENGGGISGEGLAREPRPRGRRLILAMSEKVDTDPIASV
jgi:hypothetical protein